MSFVWEESSWDLIAPPAGKGPLSSSTSSARHFFYEFFLGPPAFAFLSLALQVIMPIGVLTQWFHHDSVTVERMLLTFNPATSGGGGAAPGPNHAQYPNPWFLLAFMKIITGIFIYCYVVDQDYRCICYMLLPSFRLLGVRGARGNEVHLGRRVTIFVLVAGLCTLYALSALLVFLVSLLLVGSGDTPLNVLINGVGAMFILQIDDELVNVSNEEFDEAEKDFEERWTKLSHEDWRRQQQHRQQRRRLRGWRLGLYMASVLLLRFLCMGLLITFCVAVGRHRGKWQF